MTKYKIIGSYSTTNKSVEKSTDDCTITIPLKSSAGTLNYGIYWRNWIGFFAPLLWF